MTKDEKPKIVEAVGRGHLSRSQEELIAENARLRERLRELWKALSDARQVIHADWCTETHHAEPCRQAAETLGVTAADPIP